MKTKKNIKAVKKSPAVAETVKNNSRNVKAKEKKEVVNERYFNFTERALKANNSKRTKLFNALRDLVKGKKLPKEPKEFTVKNLIEAEYVAKGLTRKIYSDLNKDGLAFNYEELPFKAKKVTSLKLSIG
jgi:hypothetical protein